MIVHDLGWILLVFNFLAVKGNDEVATRHDGAVAKIRALGAAMQTGAIGCATATPIASGAVPATTG